MHFIKSAWGGVIQMWICCPPFSTGRWWGILRQMKQRLWWHHYQLLHLLCLKNFYGYNQHCIWQSWKDWPYHQRDQDYCELSRHTIWSSGPAHLHSGGNHHCHTFPFHLLRRIEAERDYCHSSGSELVLANLVHQRSADVPWRFFLQDDLVSRTKLSPRIAGIDNLAIGSQLAQALSANVQKTVLTLQVWVDPKSPEVWAICIGLILDMTLYKVSLSLLGIFSLGLQKPGYTNM